MSALVDSTTLTFNLVDMPKCRVGEEVAVEKTHTKEVYRGKVVKLAKPNAFVVYVHVVSYFKDTTLRDRFKSRVIPFRNSKKIRIHLISDPEDLKRQKREARKMYSKHRRLLQSRREEVQEFITVLQSSFGDLLGISVSTRMSDDDMKKLNRAVARAHHPDRLTGETGKRQREGLEMMIHLAKLREHRKKVLNK